MPSAYPDPTPTTTDQGLIRLLQIVAVESDRFVERFGALHGLHRTDMNALAFILESAKSDAPVSPSRLAEQLGLSPSATTALVDRLEASGHLERHRDPVDRRRVTLAMSPSAIESGRAIFAPLAEVFADSWADFDDEQRRTIARFLASSIDAMRAVR